jgi:hypothetical protein
MKDTTSEIANKQLEIMLLKSESERFRIGDELNAFGRKVLESSILSENPGMSELDLKIEVFKRCYSSFYSLQELNRIIISIENFDNLRASLKRNIQITGL